MMQVKACVGNGLQILKQDNLVQGQSIKTDEPKQHLKENAVQISHELAEKLEINQ